MKVWIRLGDVAEYQEWESPFEAGEYVGSVLPTQKPEEVSFGWRATGVAINPYFIGRNYVSAYWGDQDAQWIEDFSKEDKYQFERGVREGIAYVRR